MRRDNAAAASANALLAKQKDLPAYRYATTTDRRGGVFKPYKLGTLLQYLPRLQSCVNLFVGGLAHDGSANLPSATTAIETCLPDTLTYAGPLRKQRLDGSKRKLGDMDDEQGSNCRLSRRVYRYEMRSSHK